MDDEIQYRCAGFLQAEIEQFIDDTEEAAAGDRVTTTEDESSHAGSASEGDDDAGGRNGKKGKKGKPRRTTHEETPGMSGLGVIPAQSFSYVLLQIPAQCPARGLNANTS
jgi:hypothetical protein